MTSVICLVVMIGTLLELKFGSKQVTPKKQVGATQTDPSGGHISEEVRREFVIDNSDGPNSSGQSKKIHFLFKFLLCFSLISNGKNIFSLRHHSKVMPVLDRIQVP